MIFACNSLIADSLSELDSKLSNIKSMQANFSQRMIDGQNHSNIQAEGTMSIKKPSFFKWQTTSPTNQDIISNGSKLWLYDGDLEQLVIRNVSNNIEQTPYLILLSKNKDDLNKLFTVKKDGTNSFILKPKQSDNMISNIVITFDKSDDLSSLNITTSLHQYTLINFSNVKTNTEINNKDFEFIAPKGTDTIDETK
jgi:outer membrane lipoprotein carrier protein